MRKGHPEGGNELRYQNLDADGVEVKVEEDTTADTEMNHAGEVVHYLAIVGRVQGGTLTGQAVLTETVYYHFGGQRVAMRKGDVVYYTIGDHLGTTSLVLGIDGQGNAYKVAESRHYPYGEERWSWTLEGTFTTDYRFTGQRLDGYIKLYQMGARWYDSELGRWTSPDSIVPVPADPQSLNRYSYCYGNPIKFRDPTGHWTEEELVDALGEDWFDEYFGAGSVFEGREELLAFLLSKDTTSSLILDIITDMFGVAGLAHDAGLDFGGIDALGYRLAAGAGAIPFGAGNIDAILNLASGEFSFFGTPEAGLLLGESASIVGGLVLMKNLPSNSDYRGPMMNIGLAGGEIVGLNVEVAWSSPMSDQFDPTDKAYGGFLGAGLAVPGIGVYWSMAYSWEAYRLDARGEHWYPLPNLIEAGRDILWAFGHDILLHPVWPWSPYN